MPDIQFFDAVRFFQHRIGEVEQTLIAKKAELEILTANLHNLEKTIAGLRLLEPEHQQALQPELVSLREVLSSTQRSITGLTSEIEILQAKLAALHAAQNLIEIKEKP